MKLDFTKVKVLDLEDKELQLNVNSREFANHIYFSSGDIGECEMAREIYKKGCLTPTKEQAKKLRPYIASFFIVPVRLAYFKQLDEIEGNEGEK